MLLDHGVDGVALVQFDQLAGEDGRRHLVRVSELGLGLGLASGLGLGLGLGVGSGLGLGLGLGV